MNALFAKRSTALSSGTVEQTFDGEALKSKAVALAAKESEGMSTAIETVMKAKEDWQGGPISVLAAMEEAYGEELEQFPEPDSETGNNPDKFKLPVTGVNGKTTMRQTSFYVQFADATKEGKAIVDELEFLRRAGNVEAIKEGIPADILALNPRQREVRENFLTGRRGTIRASYKKAMQLGHQMKAVNSLPNIVADFVWMQDDKGEDMQTVEATTKPIIVYVQPAEGKPVSKFEYFSIGAFIKLDARVAAEKGGTFEALKATVARQTGGAAGDKGKATDAGPIKTIDTFIGRFVEVYRYMDEMQMDKTQKEIGQFLKLLNSKGSDELVVTVVEFRNYLDDICKDAKLEARYTKLQQAGSDLIEDKEAAA